MLERFAVDHLKRWFSKKKRKPLILRGARQVGKSTLVRQFAEKQNLALHEINLEKHMYLNDVFKSLDIDTIIRELEAIINANIQTPESLLFLDEIQAAPHALHALRYFYEEKCELPVISAGSLLEFTLSNHSFPMPVGRVEYFHLGPMTFKEFLQSIEPGLINYITSFMPEQSIPIAAHNNLLKKLREYFFVGGMPEAVDIYSQSTSITDVRDVHRSIADTYQDDFSKYAGSSDPALMQKVFRCIPRIIGKKIKYSNISKEHRSKEVKSAIERLAQARVCHRIFHSHCSGLPLYAEIKENIYKVLFMDIGMVNHICGNDWITLQSFVDHELVNEGSLAEQFIGQHLLQKAGEAPQLCYWLREGRSTNAEVDYVLSRGNMIIPVEVKSGKSGTLKSLQQFVFHKQSNLAVRFDLNPPGLQQVKHKASIGSSREPVSFHLLSLPLYMVEELPEIIDIMRIRGNP